LQRFLIQNKENEQANRFERNTTHRVFTFGNYFGAVRSFVKMQHDYNCFFFIADIHSLTTHPTPENLQAGVKQVLAEYLACGIDPEKATIFIQSDVPEVSELYAFLNMNAYLGELNEQLLLRKKPVSSLIM
jgi:tryptophanyl-tRNA synthetase